MLPNCHICSINSTVFICTRLLKSLVPGYEPVNSKHWEVILQQCKSSGKESALQTTFTEGVLGLLEAQPSQGSALKVTPLRQWENRPGQCKSHRGHWRQTPELQDTFGTLAVTLANLLYPCKGWLGTSCFSTFNYFAAASLRCLLLCTWVFVPVTQMCISPSLSSSSDLRDHQQISGLLLGLFHTPSVMLLQHFVSRSWRQHKLQLLSGSLVGALTQFLHCTRPPDSVNDPMPATGSGHSCFNTKLSKKTVNFK